jgi:hypothetical protein
VSINATIAFGQAHVSGGGIATAVGSAGVASGAEGVAIAIPSSTVTEDHWHDAEHPPWIILGGGPVLAVAVYVAVRQRFGARLRAPPYRLLLGPLWDRTTSSSDLR